MRTTLIAAALSLTACVATPPQSQQDFLLAHKSAYIDVTIGSGTAFAISPTEVLTAWHVVEDIALLAITIDGVSPSSVTRLADLDAALLTFDEPHGLVIFELRTEDLEEAETCFISGWGVGYHWFSEGLGTEDTDRVSLDIAPGDSGSPVFDRDGRVVGIAVARGWKGNHHCWIVPVTEVLANLPETSRP